MICRLFKNAQWVRVENFTFLSKVLECRRDLFMLKNELTQVILRLVRHSHRLHSQFNYHFVWEKLKTQKFWGGEAAGQQQCVLRHMKLDKQDDKLKMQSVSCLTLRRLRPYNVAGLICSFVFILQYLISPQAWSFTLGELRSAEADH